METVTQYLNGYSGENSRLLNFKLHVSLYHISVIEYTVYHLYVKAIWVKMFNTFLDIA